MAPGDTTVGSTPSYGANFCVILRGAGGDDYFVIPYQVIAHIFAAMITETAGAMRVDHAWVGTVAGSTALCFEGRFSIQVGSYYRRASLLD